MTGLRELRALPPEPWGRRIKRAREDIAGLSMEEATEAAAEFIMVSTATISRLERLAEIPGNRHQLAIALVLCLVYGVDPAGVGLGPKEQPGAINTLPGAVREALRQEFPATSTKWYSPSAAA